MPPTRQILKIAERLYERGMLAEAGRLLGKSVDDVLPTIMRHLHEVSDDAPKLAGQITDLVATSDPVRSYFKKAARKGLLGWWRGTPEHIPVRAKPLIDTSKKPRIVDYRPVRSKLARSWAYVVQPHNFAERVYGVENNPVIEAMDPWSVAIGNTARDKTWLNLVVHKGKFGRAKLVQDASKEIASAVAPYAEKYHGTYLQWLAVQTRLRALLHGLKKIRGRRLSDIAKRTAKASSRSREAVLKKLISGDKALSKQVKKLTERSEELEKVWRPAYNEMMLKVAREFPDARVYMLADTTWSAGQKGLRKRFEQMVSPAERKAAEHIKAYMKKAGEELKEAGVPIIERPGFTYMSHIFKKHLEPRLSRAARDRLARMPRMLEFAYRAPGSVPWMPSARATMDWYIPNVNRVLAFQPFFKKWGKHVNGLSSELREWWNGWFYNNMYSPENTIFQKLTDWYANTEYMRLIGFSPSVAYKHMFKLLGTYFEHGLRPTAQGMKEAMRYARTALKSRRISPLYKQSEKLAHAYLADRYLKAKILYQSLAEMPGVRGMRESVYKWTSMPTSLVEFLDRGVTLYSTIAAGARHGASFEQIHKGIWNTILDVNFLGAFDQFRWQRKPVQRVVTMFTMTPAKIFGHKVKLLDRAGLIPGTAHWRKPQKDIFGRSYGPKLVRFFVALGLAETAARQFDTSVWELMLHPPFLSKDYRYGGHTAYMPPLVDHIERFREDGLAEGLKNSYGYLGIFEKLHRWNKGDIPSQYRDNPWRYVLSIPYKSDLEAEQAVRRARRDVRRLRRGARRQPLLLEEVFGR